MKKKTKNLSLKPDKDNPFVYVYDGKKEVGIFVYDYKQKKWRYDSWQ